MATVKDREQRIRNGDKQMDAVLTAAIDGRNLSKEDRAAQMKTLRGKPASMPKVGDGVTVTDVFDGTVFAGVQGQVTHDAALKSSGVSAHAQRVMVRFTKPVIGARMYFPVRATYLSYDATVEVTEAA